MHPKYASKILSNGALSLYLTHPLGDMPYINEHSSPNMNATDLVYISKYCHCHCESLDMQIMSLACILREP